MMNQCFSDRDMLTDILSDQKHVTSGYNISANEAATPVVRSDFMNILTEEHQIQNDVFKEMQKRGWYPVEAADQNKITQARDKYQNMSM